MYVLDTTVISELRQGKPIQSPQVRTWLRVSLRLSFTYRRSAFLNWRKVSSHWSAGHRRREVRSVHGSQVCAPFFRRQLLSVLRRR